MRSTSRPTPDINVTPLVDVVLVLLIIFMVVTPQMEAGAKVELPKAKHPDAQAQGALQPLTVSLTREGGLYVEKEQVPEATLRTRLEAHRKAHPEQPLVLRADQAVPYEKVRSLFQVCQSLEFPGVSLQVLGQARGEAKPWQ